MPEGSADELESPRFRGIGRFTFKFQPALLQMSQIQEIQDVFRDVFQDDTLTIGPDTTANDIGAWDSLMHVTLMLEVESHFGVRFTTQEISTLKNVGELDALVTRRRAAS